MKRDYTICVHKLLVCGLGLWSLAHANPSDPIIVQGNASFENIDATTFAIIASDKAHIYWNDFSIAEGEVTQIIQPSSDSAIVIQVDSNLPSTLLGTLQANGHVFLVNPNGTMIGANGFIDTSAFLATTYSACSCALLEGEEDVFFQGDSTAAIVNCGRIKAWIKDAYLIGHQIENKGAIDAPLGTVALAAGHDVVMKPLGEQKIDILLSLIKGETEETGIDNSGMITACRAEIKADGNAYSVAIRQAGFIDAIGCEGQNSEVYLIAEKGNNGIFGAIAAENSDGTGGVIQILGENIALFENSNIDASGDKGGGKVFIGFKEGKSNALTTFVDEGVLISADAIKYGNGGKVIIGSDEMTNFYGTISACGGDDSGDGGYVEVFGKHKLDFEGEVDRSAPNGQIGTFQLGTTDIIAHESK